MPSSFIIEGYTHQVGQASKQPDRQCLIMHNAPRDKQTRKNGMREKCINLVIKFTINAVSKEGLKFGRYLHLFGIPDPVKKDNFLKNEEEIDKQELQIVLTDCIGSST